MSNIPKKKTSIYESEAKNISEYLGAVFDAEKGRRKRVARLHRLQGDRAIGLKCFSPLCLASLQRALAEVGYDAFGIFWM